MTNHGSKPDLQAESGTSRQSDNLHVASRLLSSSLRVAQAPHLDMSKGVVATDHQSGATTRVNNPQTAEQRVLARLAELPDVWIVRSLTAEGHDPAGHGVGYRAFPHPAMNNWNSDTRPPLTDGMGDFSEHIGAVSAVKLSDVGRSLGHNDSRHGTNGLRLQTTASNILGQEVGDGMQDRLLHHRQSYSDSTKPESLLRLRESAVSHGTSTHPEIKMVQPHSAEATIKAVAHPSPQSMTPSPEGPTISPLNPLTYDPSIKNGLPGPVGKGHGHPPPHDKGSVPPPSAGPTTLPPSTVQLGPTTPSGSVAAPVSTVSIPTTPAAPIVEIIPPVPVSPISPATNTAPPIVVPQAPSIPAPADTTPAVPGNSAADPATISPASPPAQLELVPAPLVINPVILANMQQLTTVAAAGTTVGLTVTNVPPIATLAPAHILSAGSKELFVSEQKASSAILAQASSSSASIQASSRPTFQTIAADTNSAHKNRLTIAPTGVESLDHSHKPQSTFGMMPTEVHDISAPKRLTPGQVVGRNLLEGGLDQTSSRVSGIRIGDEHHRPSNASPSFHNADDTYPHGDLTQTMTHLSDHPEHFPGSHASDIHHHS